MEEWRQIGAAIQRARTRAKLTQLDLGLAIGLKGGNEISRWERGRHPVSDGRLLQIAGVLAIDPGELRPGLAPRPSLVVQPRGEDEALLLERIRALEGAVDRLEQRLDRALVLLGELRARRSD